MFKNHILSSFRAIRQSSIYGLLSIAGLAMGITFAGLIFLWVEKELQFDHQYGKHNQLYSIRLNMDNGGKLESNESVPGPMAKAIRGTIPGLVNNCRFGFSRELFGVKDNINYADGAYVDTSFFSMMQLPFVSGNTAGFDHPHTIVLTEKMAQQFFGAINPTGKTVKLNNAREFVVIGVIGNPPLNSRLQFDWLAPIANYLEDNTWLEPWGNFGIFTLVELSAGTDVSRVNQALSAILQPTNKIYAHANCRLWSMNDWHLRNNFINGEQNGGAIHVVKLIAAMGASVSSLAALLSSEFLRLVVLACLIAIPLVWWALHVALAYYPDRVPFHWWVFGIAAIGAILIALLTVCFQAIRTALMNPVKTLRAE
jgi:putative ABC transport system permease protein